MSNAHAAPSQSRTFLPDAPTPASPDELAIWAAGQVASIGAIEPLNALGLTSTRERAARKRLRIASSSAAHPLDFLAGTAFGPAFWTEVWRRLPGEYIFEEVPDNTLVDLRKPATLPAALAAAAEVGDDFAQVALCAVVAGMLASGDLSLALLEPHLHRWILSTQNPTRRDVTLAFGLALGVQAAGSGLAMPGGSWSRGTPQWRFEMATWLLPLGRPCEAHRRLIDAVDSLGFSFADPWSTGFDDAPTEVLDHAIGLAYALGAGRRIQTDLPELLDDPKRRLQVLLVEDNEHAYAWVGREGVGVLVAFAPGDPLPFGLPVTGASGAALVALGWYLDLCVSARSGSGPHYSEFRSHPRIRSWRPTKAWGDQYDRVTTRRREPVLARYVRPHVRTYDERYGSDEARLRAPESYRFLMGLHDTWVRGYWTGSVLAADAVRSNLRRAAALADVLALLNRAG